MTGEQNTINQYVPDNAELTPSASWRPTLTAAPSALIAGHAYQIAGKQLNGLTHANGYGDDRQMATNYPLVRLTNSAGRRALPAHARTSRRWASRPGADGDRGRRGAVERPARVSGRSKSSPTASPRRRCPCPVGTRDCFLIMDRSTAGQGEVQALIALNGAPAVIDPAILVVVEGYTAGELGLTAANLARRRSCPTFASPLAGDPRRPARRGDARGPEPAAERAATLHLPVRAAVRRRRRCSTSPARSRTSPSRRCSPPAGQTVANAGLLRLLKSPDPYILDGDPGRGVDWWTSIDMRVFQVTEGGHKFGATVATSGAAVTAATSFIQTVLANLNTHPALGSDFDAIDPQEAPEALTLAPTDGSGHRVYNFAVAKVRLRDLNQDAPNVRAFFRMWPAQQTNAVHDPNDAVPDVHRRRPARSAARPAGRRDRDDPVLREPARRLGDRQHDDADRRAERAHDRARQPRAPRSPRTSAAGSTSTSRPTCGSRRACSARRRRTCPTGRSRARGRCCRSSSTCAACTSA